MDMDRNFDYDIEHHRSYGCDDPQVLIRVTAARKAKERSKPAIQRYAPMFFGIWHLPIKLIAAATAGVKAITNGARWIWRWFFGYGGRCG